MTGSNKNKANIDIITSSKFESDTINWIKLKTIKSTAKYLVLWKSAYSKSIEIYINKFARVIDLMTKWETKEKQNIIRVCCKRLQLELRTNKLLITLPNFDLKKKQSIQYHKNKLNKNTPKKSCLDKPPERKLTMAERKILFPFATNLTHPNFPYMS